MMLLRLLSALGIVWLAACQPAFTVLADQGSPTQDGDMAAAPLMPVLRDLVLSCSAPDPQNNGVTSINMRCALAASDSNRAVTATTDEKCGNKTGYTSVACTCTVGPALLDDPAYMKAKSLTLRYHEDKLLPFAFNSSLVPSKAYDAIQSFASIRLQYSSLASASDVEMNSVSTLNVLTRTVAAVDQRVALAQKLTLDSQFSFSSYLACSTSPATAHANQLKDLDGTFSWTIKGLQVELFP